MPNKFIHKKYYERLNREHPELIKDIDVDFIQWAIDSSREDSSDYNKKQSHETFDNFLKRYIQKSNEKKTILLSSIQVGLMHTLKFYFVNHLAADMIHNINKDAIPDWNTEYKQISDLGEPYNSYGEKLLIRMGVYPEHILNELKNSKKRLLVNNDFKINVLKIKHKEPIRSFISRDYVAQRKHKMQLENK